jgi:hypothetical protein
MKKAVVNALASVGISIGRYVASEQIRSLVERLHPVSTAKELIRVGGQEDGGYLVPDDLDGIVACFSPGVDVVASFEAALVEMGMPCFLADASVIAPPIEDKLIRFVRKFVGVVNDDTTTTLDFWVKSCAPPTGDLIMQMDIEGGEWLVLLNVSEEVLKRFRIIVIELHYIDRLVDQVGFPVMCATLDRLLREFHVVHNHPNNVRQPLKKGNLTIPAMIELTLLRKDRAEAIGYARQFPHPLDRKNVPNRPDVILPSEWYRSVI